MLKWYIAMGDRQAPLDTVGTPAIRSVTDPIRDHMAAKLAPIEREGDLIITFIVEDDRSLLIRLSGDSFMLNQARDVLGEEEKIGPLLT